MDKKERFIKAYNYLRGENIIATQQDLADAMKASRSNISSALKGDERVLTDKFITRFAYAYQKVFNLNWLLTGVGEMLVNSKEKAAQSVDHSSLVNDLIASQKETIESLKRELAKSDLLIESLKREIAELRASKNQPFDVCMPKKTSGV